MLATMNDRNYIGDSPLHSPSSAAASATTRFHNNLSYDEDAAISDTWIDDDDSSSSNNISDFSQSWPRWLPATPVASTNNINTDYNVLNFTSQIYYDLQDIGSLINASGVDYDNGSDTDFPIFGVANVTIGGSTPEEVGGSAALLQAPVLAVILAIFCVITIFGNVLVMVAVVRERYLHTVTNYFIVSLATADCLVGTVVMPFSAVHEVMNKYWVFGRDWCDVWHSIDVLASTASILNLCVISLDRYWAIHDPISYPSRMTTRRALLLIALLWMCASLISFPAIAWWRAVNPDFPPDFACVFTEDLGYLVFSSTISFYAPLAVMAFTYFKIYRAAAQQSRSLRLGTKQVLACNGESIGLTLRIHRGGGGMRMSSNFRHNVQGHHHQQDNHNNHHHSQEHHHLQQHQLVEMGERESLSSSTHDMRVHGPRRHLPVDLGSMNDGGENVPLNLDVDIHDHNRNQEEQGNSSSGRLFRGFRRPWNRQNSGSGFSAGSGTGSVRSAPSTASTTTVPMSPNQNRTLTTSTTTNPGSMRVVPKHLKHFSISRRLARLAREQKAAKTLGIVMGVFVLCWLPFFIFNVMLGFCPEDCFPNSDLAFTVVTWLGWINSGMNPVIYACWSRDFRRAFVKILCGTCPRMTRRSYRTRLRTRTASRTMSTPISSSCSAECVRL